MQRLNKISGARTSLFCIFVVPVVILLLLAARSSAESVAGGEGLLITKIINAYGGKGLLSKVRTISAEGRIRKYLPDDEGTYIRRMTRERKLSVDIRYSGTSEKRILNGQNGYRGTNGKVEKVLGPPFDAMVYQYNQLNLPFGLIDGSFSVTESTKGTFNGREVEILKLQDAHGYKIDVNVDPKDYMIRRVTGRFTAGNHETSLSAAMTDFRKVDGVLLPFKIINYAGDTKLSETVITTYKINPAIDDSTFNP